MDRKIRVVLFVSLLLATGCTLHPNETEFAFGKPAVPNIIISELRQDTTLSEEATTVSLAVPSESEPIYPEINVPNVPEVNFFVSDYFNKRKNCLLAYQERRQQYGAVIEKIFRKYGLPEDLIHLAMVESGFVPTARSPMGAVGMWQFVAATARRYGLRVGKQVDERKDVEKASEAAAKHLVDLYGAYGDWALALAAYNSGEGTVNRAVERSGSRDFFEMARRGLFPRETKDYVARFMAIALIHRDVQPYLNEAGETVQFASVSNAKLRE